MNIETFYNNYFQAGKITIDSRNISIGDVFFAFSGKTFNAATIAEKAIDDGAVAVIVEQKEYENVEKNIFFVPSTLEFLQQLSSYHRDQLDIPIIALTGSNGKTTSKELISAVLSKKYLVQNTLGNLNNHIGVPLTLLSITNRHQLAVVEMGANHKKEIEFLSSLIRPNIGYITNFGKAHLEGFGGFEGVIEGKSELYDYLIRNNQIILINEEDKIQLEKTINYKKKITFGLDSSDYSFDKFVQNNLIGITYNGESVKSNLTGDYNFTNICAAVSLGLYFSIEFKYIKTAIENYVPSNMRSQILEKGKKTLVLDTYNANPSSMELSLINFSQFDGSKTIIIGDMLELGKEGIYEHEKIFELAKSLGFEEIITVGKIFSSINTSNKSFINYPNLIEFLKKNPISTKNVLLKGSRGISLEKVLDYI